MRNFFQQLKWYLPDNNDHIKKGLIRMLVVIVIGVVMLSVIGFDIRTAVEDPQTQANFSFLIEIFKNLYDKYFAEMGSALWRIFGPMWDFVFNIVINFNWDDINSNIPAAPELR